MLVRTKRVVKFFRNAVKDPLPRRRTLEFVAADIESNAIVFRYTAKGCAFAVRMTVPDHLMEELSALRGQSCLEQALLAIGLTFAARFFKLSNFSTVRVGFGSLDPESVYFFEDFFVGGLGEFRFLQGLDPRRKVSVVSAPEAAFNMAEFPLHEHALMLNGGGKDTIVAAEMLRRAGQSFTWLTVEPNETRRRVIRCAGGGDSAIEVDFRIEGDFEQNQAYGWGHTPYAAIVMAIGALFALLTRSRYVISGNELSADSGNVVYRGHLVNHQYSKSSVHELGFWKFVRRRIHPSMEVLSVLRPFHDVQLAMLFSSLDRYFGTFVSCNSGIAGGRWCKQCPKCAFTALAIGAFTGVSGLRRIFGEDVLGSPRIRRRIGELVEGRIKPWECVGSRDECLLALALLLEKEPTLDFDENPMRADWVRMTANANLDLLRHQLLVQTSDRHLLPEQLRVPLDETLMGWSGRDLRVSPSTLR